MTRAAYQADEVAALLGVKPVTIRRWCKAGEIRGAYKLGNLWFVPAEEVERLRGYDAERAEPQRGDVVPADQGRALGRVRDDAERPAPFKVSRVEGRGPSSSAGAATPARRGGGARSPRPAGWSLPPRMAG